MTDGVESGHQTASPGPSESQVTIVGAGLMGTAVAVLCAARGYQVVLTDVEASVLQSFPHRAIPVARAITTSAEAVIETVRCDPVLETSVEGATLVHEVIHEDLEAKRTLFRRLDKLCGPEVMLATNTSSFMLSEMVSDLQGRDRVVGIHYVAPAHLIRAVEIITADFTRPELVARARAFVDSIDHVGVVCRERPGFLVNRIQYAMKAEIQRILESGIASVEDIDAAVRLAIGPRLALWGPLMQEDLAASKKTVVSVGDYLHQSTGEPHFAPTATLRRLVENGHTGAAAGRGWYRWGENYAALVGERDRQLAALLSWLRQNDRLAELGATGENPLVQEPGGPGSA